MKTSWNLGLLYKSHDDPQIEKDVRSAERAFAAFEKKYRGKTDYLRNDGKLAAALADSEALFEKRAFEKPVIYFHFLLDLNSEDAAARAKMSQLSERLTKLAQKRIFFDLAIGKIPAPLQKKFLKSKKLTKYRYLLERAFETAKHDLSEPEEKVLGLKSIPAYQLWVAGTEKLLGTRTVDFKGETMPLPQAMNTIGELPTADNRALHAAAMKVLEPLAPIAESELNAIVTNKKIDDELRGFKEPFDGTLLSYENKRESVMALVSAVTKNFSVSHRFFELKKKLLKLPHLEYADRNTGIGQNVKKVTFDEAVSTLRNVFSGIDPKYRGILDRFLESGQIDVFPKKGKKGGAYCAGSTNMPTFVFLNFSGAQDDVSTFAHEMGHAVHTELSKVQPVIYQGYSTATAEVASTLFESFVFDALFEKLTDAEKVVALHNRVNDYIQTVFRQIACFNFETEMHKLIREKGALSKEEFSALMNKHMGSYLGPAVRMQDIDGNYFVWWSHIRRFFYVYSYAFGALVSRALYAKYKEDKNFITKINAFLSAGGSDTPENIFKAAGIDLTKPDFWTKGIKSIEEDLKRLETLTK
ncbi:MAG TPA: M3 family oligoendopeptidase [Candidatus Paceibacterota bacterium]|nr:M3 family oligoendopeptidase [Candidatus Paceibacterota bacterium]